MADCDRGSALPESEAAYFAALGASRQSNGISAIRNRAPRMAVPTGRLGCYAGRAIRALRERGTMKRGRKQCGIRQANQKLALPLVGRRQEKNENHRGG